MKICISITYCFTLKLFLTHTHSHSHTYTTYTHYCYSFENIPLYCFVYFLNALFHMAFNKIKPCLNSFEIIIWMLWYKRCDLLRVLINIYAYCIVFCLEIVMNKCNLCSNKVQTSSIVLATCFTVFFTYLVIKCLKATKGSKVLISVESISKYEINQQKPR